ncbi:hypothetical protein ACWELJ_02600 [Nocardia sp. NPDC004582]
MKNIRRVGFSAAGIAAVSAAIALTAPIASATTNDCPPGTTTPPTTTTPPKTTTPSTGGFDAIIKALGSGSAAANSGGIGAGVGN